MMTGDWGGGVGMALTLAPRITNPGRQSLADAQHVWEEERTYLTPMCKKRDNEKDTK